MQTIFSFILYSILFYMIVYYLLPEILLHFLGVGSWKRQYSAGVCLTFDDGPDPEYTPHLLDLLAKHNLKACFFLVGEKVQQNPELIQRIQNEGHLIGSHGYHHQHSWLMSPLKTWQIWDKSVQHLGDMLGKEPDLIRPPWGGFNLALYLWCKVRKKRIVIWNAKGNDWNSKRTSKMIMDKILSYTKEGTIILLHDSGGDQGAPANMLASLDELCARIKGDLKLPIVPLEFPDWSLWRRLFFRLWEKWEHLYTKFNRINRIDDKNLFRLSLSQYHGPELYNEHGELLAKEGDRIGEIHFDNIRLQSFGTNLQAVGIRALKQVRVSLPSLAKYIRSHPDYQNVKVYIGVTMINRGVKGLGFSVEEYPFSKGNWIGFFQKILMQIYHPAGSKRDTSSLGTKPKIVWISTEKLIEKYDAQGYPPDDKIIS